MRSHQRWTPYAKWKLIYSKPTSFSSYVYAYLYGADMYIILYIYIIYIYFFLHRYMICLQLDGWKHLSWELGGGYHMIHRPRSTVQVRKEGWRTARKRGQSDAFLGEKNRRKSPVNVYYPWRIHGAGIYANIGGILMGSMEHHIWQHHGSVMGYEEFHLKITRFHRQPPLQCGDSPTFRRQETHEIDPEDGDTLMAAWTMAIAACGEVHP